ncbi:MAG TPA: hypothetical protein VF533_22770 [Solirubrobacteraceae bacterium]
MEDQLQLLIEIGGTALAAEMLLLKVRRRHPSIERPQSRSQDLGKAGAVLHSRQRPREVFNAEQHRGLERGVVREELRRLGVDVVPQEVAL